MYRALAALLCCLFGMAGNAVELTGMATLKVIGRYQSGQFNQSATETVAFEPTTRRLFVTGGGTATLSVLDFRNPSRLRLLDTVDLSEWGTAATCVAAKPGLVAVTMHGEDKSRPGRIVFLSPQGAVFTSVGVGALPDMVAFTPDGKYALTANEGEPNQDLSYDPRGSIAVVWVRDGGEKIDQSDVYHIEFRDFDDVRSFEPGVRIFGPGASPSQDFEPEFLAISPDSRMVWVTLQENNAIAVVDIIARSVKRIAGLGFKDHSIQGNGLDSSDEDGIVRIQTHPVMGMYQPDAIAAFSVSDQIYLITANEGDARDYEVARVSELALSPDRFISAATAKRNDIMGRLEVTRTLGDDNQDGVFEQLYAFGARSFSIWDSQIQLVYDSGDALEQITAATFPAQFNSDKAANKTFDGRSDNRGPEPEGCVVGIINGKPYGFIGLEQIGGIVTVDLSTPSSPSICSYVNTRNFDGRPDANTAGDLAPEGMIFIPAAQSPTKRPLLVVAFEVSGSVTVFEVVVRQNIPKPTGPTSP